MDDFTNLAAIRAILCSKKSSFAGDYFIPSCWNNINYTDYKTANSRPGEININPYDFFTACINQILSQKTAENRRTPFGII